MTSEAQEGGGLPHGSRASSSDVTAPDMAPIAGGWCLQRARAKGGWGRGGGGGHSLKGTRDAMAIGVRSAEKHLGGLAGLAASAAGLAGLALRLISDGENQPWRVEEECEPLDAVAIPKIRTRHLNSLNPRSFQANGRRLPSQSTVDLHPPRSLLGEATTWDWECREVSSDCRQRVS